MQEMKEMQAQSLSREDPLVEDKATYSSILAQRIRMDREAQLATVHGVAKSQTFFATEAIKHANLQFYSVSFLKNTHKKPRNKQRREFPVVQWLGLCAFTAEERPEFNAWSGNQDPASHGAQPKKPDQNKTKKKTNQAKHTGFSLRTFRHTFGMPAAYMASTVKLFFLKIPICYMIFKRLYFLDDGK